MKKLIKTAWLATFPVFIGYISVGFAFGLLFQQTGLPFYWAVLMSLIVYAGSMQFVAIGLLTAQASPFDIFLMTLFVNFRHLFYGLSLIHPFHVMGKLKPYMIFSLTDETYSLLIATQIPQNMNPVHFRFTLSLMNQSYWILGTLLGGAIGLMIPFQTQGLDFILTALFTVLLLEQWLQTKNPIPISIGIGSSIISLLFFGASNMIIPSTIMITLFLIMLRKQMSLNGISDKEADTHE